MRVIYIVEKNNRRTFGKRQKGGTSQAKSDPPFHDSRSQVISISLRFTLRGKDRDRRNAPIVERLIKEL
jgi:hypothetical protein